MPKFHSSRIKHRMAEQKFSSRELAEQTGIPWGAMRNAIAGRDPLNLDRVYDIARALRNEKETLRDVVADLLGTGEDGVPDPPPDQTKPKPKPVRRKEKGRSGPKRTDGVRGAA